MRAADLSRLHASLKSYLCQLLDMLCPRNLQLSKVIPQLVFTQIIAIWSDFLLKKILALKIVRGVNQMGKARLY